MSEPAKKLRPGLCQVCGRDCGSDKTSVSITEHTKAKGESLLAYLCLRCYARGILWSAEQSARPAS